ncbi:MAG: DUF58 domain-containing protein [Alphaproteobacteria bacterium]|nr:DUF58 domain-containing protein [Alphaproteobacteria bacterium]
MQMLLRKNATRIKDITKRVWHRNSAEAEQESGVVASLEELISIGKKASGILVSPAGKIMSVSSGLFRSTFKGRGMEFDEVRKYQPGDDIRHIHWRVTARTGMPHTKLFQEEKERPVHILVDNRLPMKFGTRTAFKTVVAARIAAILAWASLDNGDRVGGIVLSPSKIVEMPPQRNRRRLLRLLHTISEATSENGENGTNETTDVTPLSSAIGKLNHIATTGSLIFIISDFHDFDEKAIRKLGNISLHSDIAFIKVNDPTERTAPAPNLYKISDGNAFAYMETNNKEWCKEFEERFKQRHDDIKDFCNKRKIAFVSISTDDDIVAVLKSSFNGGKKHG